MILMSIDRTYQRFDSFYAEVVLVAGEWADPVKIPGGQIHSVAYYCPGAEIQTTLSDDTKIAAGTAIWQDIDNGIAVNPSINAIRARHASGGTFLVRAQ